MNERKLCSGVLMLLALGCGSSPPEIRLAGVSASCELNEDTPVIDEGVLDVAAGELIGYAGYALVWSPTLASSVRAHRS